MQYLKTQKKNWNYLTISIIYCQEWNWRTENFSLDDDSVENTEVLSDDDWGCQTFM